MRYIDIFNFSTVCKSFIRSLKATSISSTKWEFGTFFSFDPDYFDFISEHLVELGNEISKHFEPFIRKNNYFFNLVNLKLKELTYELLPFKIFPMYLFIVVNVKQQENARDFFVEPPDIGSKIDHYFKIQKSDLGFSTMKILMCQVKTSKVILNLYYVIGNFFEKLLGMKILVRSLRKL